MLLGEFEDNLDLMKPDPRKDGVKATTGCEHTISTATFFASTDGTGAALATLEYADVDTGMKDAGGNRLTPAAAMSGRFEGYLEAPESGACRFFVELAKQNSAAELRFDHLPDPVFLSGVAATDDAVLGNQPDEFL